MPAMIDDLSVNGASLTIMRTNSPDRYGIGANITFRINGASGVLRICHLQANHTGLRLGVEFVELSEELERTIYDAIYGVRHNAQSLERRWANAL